jgi:multicomponent Na+:H+ antiporter subunit G
MALFRDIVTALLMGIGASFMLIAAIGLLRFKDLYMRMHAAAKVGTLGVSAMILAVAVHFGELGITIPAVLVVLFLFMTAPVAAHMIARAGYSVGVPLWEATEHDEMREVFRESRKAHAASDADHATSARRNPDPKHTSGLPQ